MTNEPRMIYAVASDALDEYNRYLGIKAVLVGTVRLHVARANSDIDIMAMESRRTWYRGRRSIEYPDLVTEEITTTFGHHINVLYVGAGAFAAIDDGYQRAVALFTRTKLAALHATMEKRAFYQRIGVPLTSDFYPRVAPS